MAAILNSAILNWTILDSAILVFPFKLTHTCQDWFHPFAQKTLHSFSLTQLDDGSHLKLCHVGFIHFAKKKTSIFHSQSTWWWQPSWILPFWLQPFCQKKNFIHSFWLNLMMAAILNSTLLNLAMVDSAILHKTLTQTNSIWLKLFHFHLTWWWWPSWIWLFWIQQSLYFLSNSLTLAKIGFHHLHKKTSLIHCDSTWWMQPSWILHHLELPRLGHLGFSHLSYFLSNSLTLAKITQKHSLHFDSDSNISFIHSNWTWWW